MSANEKKLSDYIQPSLVFLGEEFEQSDNVFDYVHNQARKDGFVEEIFLEKIKAREVEFPTGIQLEKIGVAIPHTDAECIREEFISVLTVPEGVSFARMDLPTSNVEAKIIFVLGLKEPHAQLSMLQSLISILRQTEEIEKLQTQKEVQAFIEQIKEIERNEEN
ncbi:PTS system, galactitol-specific IIA component [Pilibacter termitis]|uniref:PTS system, galactitol-specific IIA component n=1 Tax=Pilibacter termitis TaxID=263852 RepID=A0A1T4LZ68_9ENTE|nr:PTS sugar transporter subunit IIA [Pilibacter termitis]SJZ59808.1 PTS system, galactitol-specific IIA component [Pilibacter termitis]